LPAVHLAVRGREPDRPLLLAVRRGQRALPREEPGDDHAQARAVRPEDPTRGGRMIKRAILIAAGRGKRLGPHTEEIPKCMVEVGGRPILGWVWRALERAGVDELVVIRGYRGDVLERFVRTLVPHAIFVDNHDWQTNNVLLSLA